MVVMRLYAVYYVDSEGNCVSGECFCVGSGGSLAYSILDDKDLHGGKELADLGLDEAVETACWAIRHAAQRDGYSGGYINIIHIDASGVKHIHRIDSRKMVLPSHMKIEAATAATATATDSRSIAKRS
jgi:20S proteasome alpha/beta subunit